MAFQVPTIVRLGQAAITTSATTLYTVPSSSRTFVENIDVVNTGASTASVDIYLVPFGGTADTSNALFYQQSLTAKQTLHWAGLQVIDAGATIQIKASATGITITASGETYEYA
jgi:hypothetical protein